MTMTMMKDGKNKQETNITMKIRMKKIVLIEDLDKKMNK